MGVSAAMWRKPFFSGSVGPGRRAASLCLLLSAGAIVACGGSRTMDETVTLTSAYGGEIKLERIVSTVNEFPPTTSMDAFFISRADPSFMPMPPPGVCYLPQDKQYWPTTLAPTRDYVDAGTVTVTLDLQHVTMTAVPDGIDTLGRQHSLFYGYLQPDADTVLPGGRSYTIAVSGSSSVPAMMMPDVIALPTAPVPVQPPAASPAAIMDPSQDYQVEMDAAPAPPPGTMIANFLVFQTTSGPAMFCTDDQSEDGKFTVPAALIASLPPQGTLVRARATQKVAGIQIDGQPARRLDLIGTNCVTTPFVVAQ
jgi:hypothetical protein